MLAPICAGSKTGKLICNDNSPKTSPVLLPYDTSESKIKYEYPYSYVFPTNIMNQIDGNDSLSNISSTSTTSFQTSDDSISDTNNDISTISLSHSSSTSYDTDDEPVGQPIPILRRPPKQPTREQTKTNTTNPNNL